MASARSANANKSLLLITLMILMTQVGYLENLNPWINGEQTLDETDDVIETGGSGSSNTLTPSTEGASVLLGDTMIPITFEYDAAIANRQLLSNNLGISDQLSCAILENGSVACWGYNQYGQSGNSSSTSTFSSTPELTDTMPGNQKAVALDTSKYTGCALLENGSVACWGWTWGYGEMGDGTQTMGVRAPGLTGSFGSHRSAVEVSTANQGACVLLDNGSVSCWGEGSKGTIGDGITTDYRSSPTPTASLPNGKKAVALTSGHTHHCALLEDGNVACWGSNSQGQLGDNSTTNRNTPTLTQPLGAPAIAIESDYAHTCALLSNGSVVCWGDNAYGQIGNGASGGDILTPTFVSNITGTVVSITTSVANTCALLYNNSVMCWGDNTHGQIGNGTTSSGTTPDYTSSFATNQTKLMLDGGGNGSCALVDNGSMHCWGENSKGSIGDGTTNDADTPTLVDTSMTFLTTHITELTSASACSTTPSLPTGLSIDSSTCTISGVPTAAVDNRTYTVTATVNGITFQNSIWLSTAYRNMTPSVDGADVYVGVDMQDITFETSDIGSSSLAMTFQSTCAIINNGTVKCWGNSANGRLGNGASGSVGSNSNDMGDALPVTNLGTGRTATALSSAYKRNYAHTCAVLDDGTVKCWGVNSNGQLGIGSTTSVGSSLDDMGDNLSAVDLGGGRTAVDIATGVGFTCALLDTGAVKCWGANGNGQLGIGNTTQMGDHTGEMGDNLSTVDLGTGRTAVAVAAGYHHACAILDNGSVKCWGFNNAGQLGHSSTVRAGNDSSNMGDALPFTPLAQGRTAVHIDAGSAHTCVVFDNGSVQCWGSNTKGQLGLGTSSNMGDNTGEMGSHLPFVDLGTGRTAVDLTTMEESTCAVLDNGSVKCWGRNDHGQLGQGVSTQKIGHAANQMGDNLAVTNLGTGSAKAIAIGSGYSHACAVFDNGSLKCWGSNGNPSGSFHGWLGFPSSVATVGRSAGDMGDNLPFVNLGTNVGMNGTSFTSCVTSPNLPTGVSIDTSTCSISGAPTVESTNQTYTVTGLKNGKYYQGSFWLSSSYIELTPSVEGADLIIDEAMENITFQFNTSATINRAMQNGVPVGILSGCGYELISHVMDSNDHHHLTHYDGCNSDGIYYSTNSGGSWTTTLIDSGVYGMGYANAIAVDSNDNPHIAYGIDNLYYTTLSNGVWSSPIVLDQTVGREISMIIDSSDNIHIASNKFITGGDLNYTSYVSGTWSTETVAAASSLYPGPTAIAVDSAGDVYIAMVQEATSSGANTNYLSVYNNSGGSWSSDFIDSGALGDYSVDLAIDSNDVTHLYYRKGGQHVIKNDASGSWSSDLYTLTGSTWDSMGDMVVESDGTVHIVAKHGTNSAQFQYATNKSGSWVNQAIANSSGFVHPTYNALALNSQGDMHYFFRAGSSGQTGVLYHLVESGASTVGSGSNAGQSSGSGSGSSTSSSLTAQNIAGGRLHTCAIVDDGKVACWGDNIEGQLGDGTTIDRSTPTLTASLGTGRTAVQLATGDFFTCVLLDNDEVKCWGDNQYGQLGDGTTTDRTSPPSSGITFPTGRTPVALAAGDHQACAIMDDGSLTCWGNNHLGQIGDGTTTNRNSPTVVSLSSGDTVIKVGSGDSHSCALLDSGSIKCWGIQQYGQLGDGTTSSSGIVTTPALTNSLGSGRTAVNIGVGEMSTCALLDNDEVKCWGRNDVGELGDGTTTASNSPPSSGITFPSGETPVDLTNSGAGIFHYCALLDSGNVSCWGWNLYGTLGDGTTTNRLSPTLTDSLGTDRTAVHVTTGYGHTCALLDNGDIKCMGWNDQGQLGDGTTTDRTSPTLVSTSYTFNTALGSGSSGSGSGSGGGMTNVTNAMSCVATPSLPAGLNIDSNTCTISGTPTVEAVNATYEINATISGVTYIGSVWLSAAPFGTITSAVEGAALNLSEAMTPIALNYTSQAPPGSSGNGTTWIPTPPSGIHISNPRMADYFMLEHDDVIYFDAMMSNSRKAVYAFSTVNGTMWNTYDISSINSATNFQPYTGDYLAQFVGDDLFFTIKNGSGFSVYELWVYSTSNGTTWRAMQQTASSYGFAMAFVIGDRLYFDESHSGSQTFKFGVYDTSNHTYWNHSTTILSPTVGGCDAPGANFHTTVGDTIYFDACDASQSYGNEMYAFNTINGSYWRTTDLDNGANDSNPGERMHIVIDDVIYFDAQVGTGAINTHALYAYNTSNGTSWLAADLNEPGYDMTPHSMDTAMPRREPVVIGDTLYFDAAASPYTARTSIGSTCTGGHTEIYAYNIDNETAWCVADAGGGGWSGSGHNSGAAHNMLHLIGDVLLFDAETGSTQGGTQTRTNSLWAHNLSNGSTWEITTKTTFSDIISEVGNGFTVFSTDNALYFPARNNTVGMEVWGYDVVNETYWLVNDTCPGVCGGISGGDFHTLVHQGVFYSSVRISQTVQGEQHILGAFNPVYSSSTSSGGSGGGSSGGSSGVTWSTHPALPAGMSISAGVISGTPTVYALNQTYTIYANQSGYSTTHELYFSVDTNNAHTVVENQTIDPIGFHPPFSDGTTTWTVSPNLPASLTNSSTTGEITGTVTSTTTNATYTVTATHSDGSTETFTFNLQSLADYDGDGLANDLPSDYDAAEGPTPGLVADTDDDADGLLDTVETNTGTYVDSSNTGTDPLNPDTDGDGICDGPNAVSGVCVSGPDITNGGTVVDTPIVLLNNSDAGEIAPFYPVTGATYGLSPDLPTSMQFDSSNGSIWGAPDMLKTNTTYTMWANLTDGTTTSWTFFLEVLEDLDGDGMPDVLPGDYDAVNDPIRTPGLEEDLDDDGDGYNDTAETNTGLYLNGDNTGTDPRDPDTDDDGICDGPGTVAGVCTAGPDLTPFGPTATVVAVNNTMIPSVPPYYAGSGLTYGYSPDLPNGLTIDPNNGYLMGIPTETTGNITYTIYANDTNGDTYSWDFTIEVLEDSDGDGSPDSLPSDYDGDNDSIRAPPGLTEDLDDDGDGASDLDEIANGTEPLNPDTDGDGLCDGINAVPGVCFAGPDPYPNDPTMPIDTDGDGLPDDDSGWTGPPYADDDDDNDGYSDVSEDACGSDSLDASSIPADMDGDAICDGDDPDMDGDGIENVNETGDTTVPPGSSPINPDTDGDGICDGPESPVTSDCAAGPDMFPLDPSAWEDTDGDGYPNELFPPSTSVPPLEEDTDDDNDGWSDIDEVSCGSDPVDGTDMPVDENGDGICDVLDLDWDDDGIPNTNETDTGVYVDSSDTGTDPWNPDTDGDGFCDGPFAVMNGSEMICSAGPDPFPHDPTLPMDTDGDGLPNELPEDYIGNLVADDDDDNDGYTDVAEDTCGSDSLDNLSMPTDLDGDTICDGDDLDMDGDGILNDAEDATDSITSSSNADTDGDGVCDGPSAPAMPAGICTAGPDAFPDDPAAWDDTDGDGDPDEIVDGMTTDLVLDTDDDNDGWEDVDELDCETNSKDNMSTPFDGDDDGICDVLDTQTLGYAIYGNESDVFEAYVNQSDFVLTPNLTGMEPGTWTIEPALPDGLSFSGTARSGETGIISGIPTEASPMQNYTVTADNGRVNKSFTFGLAVLNDFDGDRIPDEESVTGLETDPDDDNDGHLDEIELKCGSDPLNQTSVPDVDEEGNCIEGRYAEDDSDDGTGVLLWCLPLVILLLVLLLLIPLLIGDKVALMGPEPENTTSSPAFMSGNGTKADPFVLRPIKKLKAGSRAESKEAISITNMSPEILVDLLDLAESSNDKRFMMYEIDGSSEESGYKLEADEEGRLRLRFVFDDGANPTYPGAEYEGLLKLGKASVYVSWTVEVKEDKRKMNQIRKEQEAAEKAEKEAKEAQEKAKAEAEAKEAEEKAEAEAKAAEEKAAKEAEKKAKAEEKAAAAALAKKEKEEAAAKKKEEAAAKKAKAAEEKAAKEAEEAEAKAKAEAEAKAAEEKAAKEAEKKAKAEEKAAAAAKKAKEEEEAKKKAEAEAKAAEEKAAKEAEKKAKAEEKAAAAAAKKAKEEEEAKKKADADAKAAAKKVEKKPAAAKEAKKQEELQRVKKRAKSIDFKVIGEASSSELKSEVKKGATTLEVANAKDFAESGSAEINDAKGSNVIAWTGKDGNTLTGVSGVTRVFAAKAVLMVKDDLQVIKGIGPFIEEKLNALGITTYRQLANMTAKLETQVNEAIEFFPGRVKRDQWVAQAKILLGMDAKLDEKALKQAEELERVAQKAEGIDFAVLGVASASEADDLQKIKGIGPFIAEKLNALGIYKFSQLANMTSEIEEEVNVAIEFFPGRVKRDEWAKQAKELAKD